MRIIDFHVHTFPDAIADKAVGKLAKISKLTPATNGTVSETLSLMERTHVDLFINLNIATAPTQQRTINQSAAKLNAAYSDRMLSFGSVHFLAADALEELDRIHAFGLPGIKLHPDYQEFMIDDRRLYPIYEKCAQLDIPIVFHAGWDCYSPDVVHAPPARSRKVAEDFPRLKIVLAHMGGIFCWDEAETDLAGLENVYFDTAMAATYGPGQAQAMRIINRHPIENILLGSDCPWEQPEKSIAYVTALPLPEDRIERILSRNAMDLLHLLRQ